MAGKATRNEAEEHQEGANDRLEGGMSEPGAETKPSSSLQLLSSIAPDLVLLGGAVSFFVLARNFDYTPVSGQLGPSFWPQTLSVGIALCAVVRLVQKIRLRGRPTAVAQEEASEESEDAFQWSLMALAVALVVGYVFGTIYLGYILATAIFLIAFLYLGGQRKWYVFPIGLLGSLAFTYIFLKVVYVALPSGVGVFDQFSAIIYRIFGIY